jgi:hypothetical protein
LSSYVASHHLAVAPQSGAKYEFYCAVYYITLNSNCEAQRVSKNLKQIVEDGVNSQKMHEWFEWIKYFLKEKIMFKSHQIKSNHRVLMKNEVDTHRAPAFAPDYIANVLAAKSVLSIYAVNQLPWQHGR